MENKKQLRNILVEKEGYQTKMRGDNYTEYQNYLASADDGKGTDITTGKPLKTFDEWLNS